MALLRVLILLSLSMPCAEADATRLCAWMDESWEEDTLRLKLWLETDQRASFHYGVTGSGLSDAHGRSHSPSSGTYVLEPGAADSPWGFAATIQPPGKIDIGVEIREFPKDIFDETPSPLIVAFAFERAIPDGEVQAPRSLAERQCKEVAIPPSRASFPDASGDS